MLLAPCRMYESAVIRTAVFTPLSAHAPVNSRLALTCIYRQKSYQHGRDAMQTNGLTVSYIPNPAVTLPPGELIYSLIGFSASSASRNKSCAVRSVDIWSATYRAASAFLLVIVKEIKERDSQVQGISLVRGGASNRYHSSVHLYPAEPHISHHLIPQQTQSERTDRLFDYDGYQGISYHRSARGVCESGEAEGEGGVASELASSGG
jgi:hypothetical protein